jgi:hypothetical protein
MAKSATLTFRINPGLKQALRTAAEHEHRSIANMVEVLIRDYCDQRGITIEGMETINKKNGVRT